MSYLGLAWAQMRTRLPALAAAMAVVALGVGLAAGMLLANDALREGFARSTGAISGSADVTVRALADGTIAQALIAEIEAVEGVSAAVPVLVTSAVAQAGDRGAGESLQLIGVDLLDDAMVRVYRSDRTPGEAAGIEDPLLFLNQPGSAIAPRAFLERHGLARGARFPVRTSGGTRELVIRGVLDDGGLGEAFGGGFLIVDLYALQDTLDLAEQVSWIDVAIAPAADRDAVIRRLRDALPAHLGLETAGDRAAEHARLVASFEAMVNVIAAIGLVLAGVITSNRLATLYQDRFWEMGVLRGIGWSPLGLVRALLGEATLLSALGTALGLPLGLLFAEAIVGRLAHTMTLNFQRPIAPAGVTPSALPMLLAAVAGIASGVVAAWLPARRAAAQSIVALKSGRRRREPRPEARWRRYARAVLPALAGLALGVQMVTGSPEVAASAMLLLLAGVGLLIRPALAAIGSLAKVVGEGARIGLRDQGRAPGRPVGAAAVLTLGLALVVWIANTTRSFETYVFGRMMAYHRADLVIDSDANAISSYRGTLRLPPRIVDELRQVPGVAVVGSEAAAKNRDPEMGLIALDEARLLHPEVSGLHLEPGSDVDARERTARGEAVLIDRLLRASRGVQVGDRLRLAAPSGTIELPVAGVTEDGFLSPKGNVTLSLALYQRAWRDDGIARAYVLAAEGTPVDDLVQRIRDGIGRRYGLRVNPLEGHAAWVAANVRSASSFLYAMAAITLLVVAIGTGDALAASVIERTREIGILRAIGYRPGAMSTMVFAQSIAIGVAGGGLAVALGLGMASAFVEGLLPSLLGWQLELHGNYALTLAALGAGLSACLLGGLLPAARASRIPVAAAIRYE